jgi:hypothetical protein
MFFGEDWVPDYAFLHDRYEAQQERDRKILEMLEDDDSEDESDEDFE